MKKLDFRREYLIRLPLPLAQLYCRARNAKDGRGRHDSCFYLFESLIKIAGMPMVACYHEELKNGGENVEALDRLLAQLALPSLGQFVGILRETARYYGERDDAETHPLGHVWGQLNEKRKELKGMLELFRRIKNGPEGKLAGDRSVTILQLIDALVTYRNAVIGHGAGRATSFYEEEMGPLMFPAVNDILEEGVWDLLGPSGSQLVLLEQAAEGEDGRYEVEVRELIGLQSERSAPAFLDSDTGKDFTPDRMAILWPGREEPLMLDPLLLYQENEISEDVLILNRDRNRKQVEFLSYATGETTRNKLMSPAMNAFMALVSPPKPKEEKPQQETAATSKPADETSKGEAQPEAATAEEDEPQADYEILAELGRGGMGIVYLARQTSLGRLVALKMLPPELRKDEVAILRFRREMRALGHCEHPNIVKVIACGTMPTGEPYYAMEYVPGTDLEQLWLETAGHVDVSVADLTSATFSGAVSTASTKMRAQTAERTKAGLASKSGTGPGETPAADNIQANVPSIDDVDILPPIPEFRAPEDKGGYSIRIARMIRDAALAVQCVHDQGFVHRDIKPGNLMLTPDGERVVLMDFGLAKQDGAQMSEASSGGGFLGTLRYSSPEMIEAATKRVGPQVDIRGLGITMWELLTRRKLFADCEDESQLSRAVMEEDVPLLRSVDPAFDRDLEAIVARACERDAEDRIETAADLALYLELYIEGKPIPIRTPGLGEMIWRWVKAHKSLVSTVATTALIVAATITVSFIMITQSRNAERAAKVEATQRFREARDTIETSLTGVSNALKFFPGVQETRTRLMKKAAEDYARFAQEKSDDPELQAESGRAFLRLGNVRMLLNEFDEAKEAFQSAETLFKELLKRDPNNLGYQVELATSRIRMASVPVSKKDYFKPNSVFESVHIELGQLLRKFPNHAELRNTRGVALVKWAQLQERGSHFSAAANSLNLAREDFEELAGKNDSPKYRFALATTLKSIGRTQTSQGNHKSAAATLGQAISAFEILVELDADNPEYLDGLASSRVELASALRSTGDLSGQLEAYDKAIADYEVLVDALPDVPRYRFNFAVARTNLGQILHRMGQNPAAKEQLIGALMDLVELTTNYPQVLRYLEQEANSGTTLANVLSDLDDTELALNWYDRVHGHYEALAEEGLPRYREGLAICRSNYAQLLHRLEDTENAKALFEAAINELTKLHDAEPNDVFYTNGLAEAWEHFGRFLIDGGVAADGEAAWEKSIALRRSIGSDPDSHSADYVHRYARSLISSPFEKQRDASLAEELATALRDGHEEHAEYWSTLGATYFRQKKLDHCINALRQAKLRRIQPHPSESFYLAMAHQARGTAENVKKVKPEFATALELMRENAPGNAELNDLLEETCLDLGIDISDLRPLRPQESPESAN